MLVFVVSLSLSLFGYGKFWVPEALLREIQGFARSRLGAAVAPKELAFVERIPLTATGKVMRRELRAREARHPSPPLPGESP